MSGEMLALFSVSASENVGRILCVHSCKFTKAFHPCDPGLAARVPAHLAAGELAWGGIPVAGCACPRGRYGVFHLVGSCELTPPLMPAGEHGLDGDQPPSLSSGPSRRVPAAPTVQ